MQHMKSLTSILQQYIGDASCGSCMQSINPSAQNCRGGRQHPSQARHTAQPRIATESGIIASRSAILWTQPVTLASPSRRIDVTGSPAGHTPDHTHDGKTGFGVQGAACGSCLHVPFDKQHQHA